MSAITSLDAATSTGASSIKQLPFLVNNHTIQVDITGGPSAVTVTLEGSLDGAEPFFTLGTKAFSAGELTATAAMLHVVDKPVNYVRTNLTVLTGGSSPTITVLYDGDSLPAGIKQTGRRGQF